jgi:hypothetical protein
MQPAISRLSLGPGIGRSWAAGDRQLFQAEAIASFSAPVAKGTGYCSRSFPGSKPASVTASSKALLNAACLIGSRVCCRKYSKARAIRLPRFGPAVKCLIRPKAQTRRSPQPAQSKRIHCRTWLVPRVTEILVASDATGLVPPRVLTLHQYSPNSKPATQKTFYRYTRSKMPLSHEARLNRKMGYIMLKGLLGSENKAFPVRPRNHVYEQTSVPTVCRIHSRNAGR